MQRITLCVFDTHITRNLRLLAVNAKLRTKCLLLSCYCSLLPPCILHGIASIGQPEYHLSRFRCSPLEERNVRVVFKPLSDIVHNNNLSRCFSVRNSHILCLYPVSLYIFAHIQHGSHYMVSLRQDVRQREACWRKTHHFWHRGEHLLSDWNYACVFSLVRIISHEHRIYIMSELQS